MKPEEIASIKSRKKLIATRRVATQNGDLAKTAALTVNKNKIIIY